jgi:hypothetical protein
MKQLAAIYKFKMAIAYPSAKLPMRFPMEDPLKSYHSRIPSIPLLPIYLKTASSPTLMMHIDLSKEVTKSISHISNSLGDTFMVQAIEFKIVETDPGDACIVVPETFIQCNGTIPR